MSRKNKTTEKNVNAKNGINNEELVSLFKNLNKSEQNESEEESDLENHEEKSELEEDVNDSNLNLQNLEFHQFMQLSGESSRSAPALERIAGSVPRPIFVGGISRGTESSGADSKDESGYVPGAGESTETKYFSEPTASNKPERPDFTRVGRTNEFREEINQERFFRQSGPRVESQSPERFERVGRFDAEKEGRRNLFERPEEKYEKYKTKLSK